MNATETQTTSRCKKLQELPPFVTERQQEAWRPDCDNFDSGFCGNPARRDGNPACPFDGKVLPLREVEADTPNDQPGKSLDGGLSEVTGSQPRPQSLQQAIEDRIVNRTGRRLQALAIERTDRDLIVRGCAASYYVKQLALQGVLEVLNSDHQTGLECNLQIVVHPPGPKKPQ